MAILFMLVLLLAGCRGMQPGPTIDPVAISTPDAVLPLRPVPPPPVLPPMRPPSASDTFEAWVPARTLPSGERVEGHWVTIPLTPPAVEVLDPARPIPRAPRLPTAQKPQPGQRTGASPQQHQTPAPTSPPPAAGPGGMSAPDGLALPPGFPQGLPQGMPFMGGR